MTGAHHLLTPGGQLPTPRIIRSIFRLPMMAMRWVMGGRRRSGVFPPARADLAHVAPLVDIVVLLGGHMHHPPLGRHEEREGGEEFAETRVIARVEDQLARVFGGAKGDRLFRNCARGVGADQVQEGARTIEIGIAGDYLNRAVVELAAVDRSGIEPGFSMTTLRASL